MNTPVAIRPALPRELPVLARLIEERLLSLSLPPSQATVLKAVNAEKHLSRLLPDHALLVADDEKRLVGLAALNLDRHEILACYLDREFGRRQLAEDLLAALEARALDFGVRKLKVKTAPTTEAFFRAAGYDGPETGGGESATLSKDLLPHAPDWQREHLQRLDELNIPADYGVRHRLTLQREATELESIGEDIFGREQRLVPKAAKAWRAMKDAAGRNGVEIDLVSGFRTAVYQAGLIKRKLEENKRLEQILAVSAAPGFSEHHTGCAVDVTTHGCPPLEEKFATTEAYQWLRANAGLFGFHESYPRKNRHGILWEPWHWCYTR